MCFPKTSHTRAGFLPKENDKTNTLFDNGDDNARGDGVDVDVDVVDDDDDGDDDDDDDYDLKAFTR